MLCEILSLMWSCNCCVTCFSVGAVVSEWKIEQIVMGGGVKWEWEIVQSS